MAGISGVSQVGFTSPYAADEADIERRRRMAELLQAEGQKGLGPTEMVGGWAIPKSPWEGVGKAAQQVSGAYQQNRLKGESKALSDRAQAEAMGWYGSMPQARQGSAPGFPGEPEQPSGQMQQPTQQERMAWLLRGAGNPASAPMAQAMLAQAMKGPNEMLGKIEPKDYTPDSFSKFMQTQDASVLRPRVKQEAVNLGGSTQFVDPYAPPVSMSHTMAPGEQARLQQQQFEWNNFSPAQRAHLQNESARTGVSVAELMFNTGQQPGGGGAAVPQGQIGQMPQVGAMAPTQNLGMPANQPQQAVQQPPSAPLPSQAPRQPQPAPAPVAPPTQATGPIINQVTPKERQALLVAKPHAEAAATSTIQNIDRMVKLATELHDHEGLSGVTGKLNQYSIGDITPTTRAARGIQDALVNQVGVQALQAMREASKTGGAVGNVTEKEWPILQQSIAALSAAQGTGDYQKALVNLKTQIEQSGQRVKQAYEQTYGPLNVTTVPHTTQGRSVAGQIKPFDAETEKRYQEWKARNGG